MQKRLLEDHYVCFYDASQRDAPQSLADYLAADHLSIVYDDNAQLEFDHRLIVQGIERVIRVTVPGFAGIPAFLRATKRLASLPSLLQRGIMGEFTSAPLPFDPVALPFYMVWHIRNRHDPRHAWVRAMLESVVR